VFKSRLRTSNHSASRCPSGALFRQPTRQTQPHADALPCAALWLVAALLHGALRPVDSINQVEGRRLDTSERNDASSPACTLAPTQTLPLRFPNNHTSYSEQEQFFLPCIVSAILAYSSPSRLIPTPFSHIKNHQSSQHHLQPTRKPKEKSVYIIDQKSLVP
jgi:hypothetical protein